ncbi:MAG: class I SAM-dependent methyltransferase, partial [Myxococcota bacterium]
MGPRPPRRESFDLFAYNREAWDHQVELGDRWTTPVDADTIARARSGELEVGLTPIRPVPPTWLPSAWPGLAVLGLGSGGGQQCPLFAAAGADVTSVDASPRQLSRDREVAEREGLSLRTLEADMRDLSLLEDASFDLVFHPVSNCFVTDVRPVWREAARVLKPGGHLLAG